MFKVPSAWRAVTVDGYVDPSGGNRVNIKSFHFYLIQIEATHIPVGDISKSLFVLTIKYFNRENIKKIFEFSYAKKKFVSQSFFIQ